MLPRVGVALSSRHWVILKMKNFNPPTAPIQKRNTLSRAEDGVVYSRAVSRTLTMSLCGAEGAIGDGDVILDGVFYFILALRLCRVSTARLVSAAWLLWMSARVRQSAVQTLLCWVTLSIMCALVSFSDLPCSWGLRSGFDGITP